MSSAGLAPPRSQCEILSMDHRRDMRDIYLHQLHIINVSSDVTLGMQVTLPRHMSHWPKLAYSYHASQL